MLEALRDDADRGRALFLIARERAKRERQQPLAVFEQRAVVPRGVAAIAGKNQQPAAAADEVLQCAKLIVIELADVRQNHDRGIQDRFRAQVIGLRHLCRNEISEFHSRRAVGLERDLREIHFAFERLAARVAIDEQQRHLVPHRDAGEIAVVSLERIGVGDDFDHMRARRVEGVREKHLPLFVRPQIDLRHGLFLAVGFEIDAQIVIRRIAEIAHVRADLNLLPDADHEPRKLQRLDGDVVLHLAADIEKSDLRRDGQRLQPRNHLAELRVLRRLETDALKIRHHHEIAARLVHLPENARRQIERRRHRSRAESGVRFLQRLREPGEVVCGLIEQRRTALAHEHDLRIGADLEFVDDPARLVARDGKIRRARAARFHRIAVVEHHDGRGLRLAHQLLRALPHRPRHAQRENRRDRRADDEQDDLFDFHPPLVRADDGFEQVHRAPFHDLKAALVEEVDDDRNRQCRDAGEESGVEESHATTSMNGFVLTQRRRGAEDAEEDRDCPKSLRSLRLCVSALKKKISAVIRAPSVG